MFDIIIVGGGVAGLTAAIYAKRANKSVLVLEAKAVGGQIINASKISNYPGIENISGPDFAMNLYNQATNLGIEIKYETVVSITKEKEVYTNKAKYLAKAIILATGSSYRKLNITNEEELVGKGVSYCATCDGNFYKNKIVAVVGGGNTAIQDAIYLSSIAKKVYVIHRRDSFRSEEVLVDELSKKDNIEYIFNANVIKLNKDEVLKSITISKDNKEEDILVDGVFIAVGQEPKNSIFKNIIDIDEKGYIKTNDGVHTNIKGIYVAGDARNKALRQLTTAAADGAIASTLAIKEMES
ncbi:MAG: thioredoxin-disulfide reductase [Bacilli bacterium]|nr:thioredoxin-disulfide reductase [Bacilli bacterium]